MHLLVSSQPTSLHTLDLCSQAFELLGHLECARHDFVDDLSAVRDAIRGEGTSGDDQPVTADEAEDDR